jgi:hypothetical protein
VPIYIEISSLHRTVTIVARGKISPDEIRGAALQMLEAKVPHYNKLIDVSFATTEFKPEQVEGWPGCSAAAPTASSAPLPSWSIRSAARSRAPPPLPCRRASGRSACSPACARCASGWPILSPLPRRHLLPARRRRSRRPTAMVRSAAPGGDPRHPPPRPADQRPGRRG